MFFIVILIIAAIIVLIVLASSGTFRKKRNCLHCGTLVDGPNQVLLGPDMEVICNKCASVINPYFLEYAKDKWDYEVFKQYLSWEEETKEERSHFQSEYEYGDYNRVAIDSERGLFRLKNKNKSVVLRFEDLSDYGLDFRPESASKGYLDKSIHGCEYITIRLKRPQWVFEDMITLSATVRGYRQGVFSRKFDYELDPDFLELVRLFSLCAYIENQRRAGEMYGTTAQDMGELGKALALFMFDSVDEVTEESLKQQRNVLMKAFHPDNNEDGEKYAKKINDAYDLLSQLVKN